MYKEKTKQPFLANDTMYGLFLDQNSENLLQLPAFCCLCVDISSNSYEFSSLHKIIFTPSSDYRP
jgi:hypothetical protein